MKAMAFGFGADEDMLRAHAERLGQSLQAERERGRAMGERCRELELALRLLGSRLASLHACIMLEPDGGCEGVDVADCRRGCATCWAIWAEMEAGRVLELRRRERERRARARPAVDMDSYRLGAD